MNEGLAKLYTGDFNSMNQEQQADGSVIITLSKHGEDKIYRFRVKDLYGEHEEVLEHEIIVGASTPVIARSQKVMEQRPETNSGFTKTPKRIGNKLHNLWSNIRRNWI